MLECQEILGCLISINPNMINHLASQLQTCQLLKINVLHGPAWHCWAVFFCTTWKGFLLEFFLSLKGNFEKWCNLRFNDENILQIWSSHSSSANNHLHNLLFFTVCHSRQVNVAKWFYSDSSALQQVMLWCWICQWNNECLWVTDDQNSQCQEKFQQHWLLGPQLSTVNTWVLGSIPLPCQHTAGAAKHRLSSQIELN